jgi:uncharacterized repeat protein (TIGR03803 family)
VLPGAPASFSVGAVGDTPYLYQWQFNGSNLFNGPAFSGVTGSTLTVASVLTSNAGTYSVIVSNLLGSTNSASAVLSVIPVTAPGVTMTTLASMNGGNSGEFPYSPLTQGLDGSFYGTALEGGVGGDGTVFKVTTNGVLSTPAYFSYNNGAIAYAGLVLGKDGFFYGATYEGGVYDDGTIFKMSAAGALTTLVSLNGQNGMLPVGGMVQGSDSNLYGTTVEGGAYGYGTVFKMTTSGALVSRASFNVTDGEFPTGVLVPGADGNFYGTTEVGGKFGLGTLFKISPSGTFTSLYSFSGQTDGAEPIAGLTLGTDGNFYGVAITGGSGGYGTVFQFNPSGTLTTLHAFTNGVDGGNPWGGLMQASDGNLYGTTQSGGTYSDGTVFRIAPGGPLVPLVQFDGYDGAVPSAALIQGRDGNLYGTTQEGGSAGDGAIYELYLGGPLQITGQPADQTAYAGGSAVFTVATVGDSPVYYQWQQDGINLTDGQNISGSMTATLLITNVSVDDAALYSVVVSNLTSAIASEDAVLGVIFSPPRITSQPVSLTQVAGTTASFSVTATGDAPLFYQWQEDGTNLTDGGNISGSTSNTLTITGVALTNVGTYSVILSNSLHAVSSDPATLVVVPASTPGVSQSILAQFAGGNTGAFPYAGLIQGNDGNLYGSTKAGGTASDGTEFRVGLAGGFNLLYSFSGGTDGAFPYGRLVQGTNGNFYGTAQEGGIYGDGTVFRMTTAGTFTSLYSYTGGIDGGLPYAGLIQAADGNFYGTTYEDGAYSFGTIFKVTSGGALTTLYAFTGGSDGSLPYAGLVQGSDGRLYGTTITGGASSDGTVFGVTTNGTLQTLVSFTGVNGSSPQAGLVQGSDGNWYGTTWGGGTNGYGTIFRVTTNGALTTLLSFNNTNGANPAGALMQGTDGNLYGTTSSGGPGGVGSVFRIATNGVLTTLMWFDGLNGAAPQGTLVQASNGHFYGTTPFGGTGFNPTAGGGYGIVFQLTVPIFTNSSFAAAAAIGGLPYSSAISNQTTAPPGDTLSFAKAAGPAWLVVGSNGVLSGTPPNSNIGTNTFVVSLTDTNGLSASATMKIVVNQDPPASFVVAPFTQPWANVAEDYSGTIATNAHDLELTNGDMLTFAKVSGPAWLDVGPDGTLSGTPEATDAGTNSFVVSVLNLGGLTNTATMFVYVNSPPDFISHTFSKPAATVNLPYSGTIATNATDPDLAAGDVLTFYKVSGPAWLGVSPTGAISGTPGVGDAGAGTYLMLVVDSGGLAAIGTMNLTVSADHPPVFAISPFTEPHANAGQAYSATIATNASDPDFGDVITLTKVGGPAWLTVMPNGVLSGIPSASDVGTNLFTIRATDLPGLSNQATMFITVAGPINLRISQNGGQYALSWTGGFPPYQVQMGTNLSNAVWTNWGAPVSSTNMLLSPSNRAAFFRVQSQ